MRSTPLVKKSGASQPALGELEGAWQGQKCAARNKPISCTSLILHGAFFELPYLAGMAGKTWQNSTRSTTRDLMAAIICNIEECELQALRNLPDTGGRPLSEWRAVLARMGYPRWL